MPTHSLAALIHHGDRVQVNVGREGFQMVPHHPEEDIRRSDLQN